MYQRQTSEARDAALADAGTKHEVILRLIDTILHEGRTLVMAQEVDTDDRVSVARLLLVVRMLNHLEAISRLAELGFETEGLILYRSMLEAMLRVAAICRTPESVNDYWAQYLLQRKGMYEDLLKFLEKDKDWAPVTPSEVQVLLEQVVREIADVETQGGKQIKSVSAYKWAQLGKVEDLFFLRYRTGSIPVHHSPQDLVRHMKLAEDGSVQALLLGPEMSDLVGLLRDSADLASMALAILEEAIGAKRSDALTEAAKAVRDMYNHAAV